MQTLTVTARNPPTLQVSMAAARTVAPLQAAAKASAESGLPDIRSVAFEGDLGKSQVGTMVAALLPPTANVILQGALQAVQTVRSTPLRKILRKKATFNLFYNLRLHVFYVAHPNQAINFNIIFEV